MDNRPTPTDDFTFDDVPRMEAWLQEPIARYVLTQRLLGEGGMGQVWEARDTRQGRRVALKKLKPKHLDKPDLRHRFLHEARATGELEHPGIVPVYELVE